MEVTETQTEGLKREYKVVVPAADIESELENRLLELGRTVELKGFRKGHVPPALVRKRFGPSVMGEVLEQAVARSSREIMVDKDVRPALQPKIEITQFGEGTDLEYTMALEILPEVDPGDLDGLELVRQKIEVDDGEVQTALERLAEQEKRFAPLDAERASRTGDVLVIDYVGSVDGEAIEGGKAEGFHLELGSGSLISGFEDQLTGAKAGEHRRIEVTFPENYPTEKLAGKGAVFEVDVKEVQELQKVELDEEFAKRRGVETLDALRDALRQQLESEYAALARSRVKRELFDILDERHDFELPEAMVEREFDAIWSQLKDEIEKTEARFEDFGGSEDELRDEYRGIAARRVRLGLLLSEIGRRHGITVEQSELAKAGAGQAMRQFPGQEKQVLDYYREHPEALETFRPQILEEKVVDFILEVAKVTDQPISASAFAKMMDEEQEADPKTAKEAKTGAKAKGGGSKAKGKSAKKTKVASAKAKKKKGDGG
jgi:trigger factor